MMGIWTHLHPKFRSSYDLTSSSLLLNIYVKPLVQIFVGFTASCIHRFFLPWFKYRKCILPTGDAFRLRNEVWTPAAGSGLSFQSLNLRLTLTLILQALLFSLDSSFSSLCMFMYVLLFCYCWKFPSASVFFWPCLEVFEILVPQLEIKPVHPTIEIQCPNHWTAREFPHSVSCESSGYYKAYYYPVLMPLEYYIRASVHHSASSIPVSPLKCAAKI